MKTYDIKLELVRWHDKNYEIEADSKEVALEVAKALARKDMDSFYDVDLLSDEGEIWTYGLMELNEVYVDEVRKSE